MSALKSVFTPKESELEDDPGRKRSLNGASTGSEQTHIPHMLVKALKVYPECTF